MKRDQSLDWAVVDQDLGPDLILFKARYDHCQHPESGRVLRRLVLERARRIVHAAEPTLRLEVPAVGEAPVSEQEDERLGLPENLAAIRCNPDGFFDEGGVQRVVIRQGDDGALEIVPTFNRLGFEIRPLIRNG